MAENSSERLLPVDDRGLLLPGVHLASLKEIDATFARFQRSDRRIRLFQNLVRYLEDLHAAAISTEVVVDGSFVMSCVDEPEDIDLIVILAPDWDVTVDLKPHEYNVVPKRCVKRDFGIEMVAVRANSVEEADWLSFFAKVNVKWCRKFGWPIDARKGLLRVAV